MSVAPVTTAPAPKASGFGFKSIGHFFSTAFSDLKKATVFVEQKALPTAEVVLQKAETITAQLVPFFPQASSALVIERALDAAAGELLGAVHAADVAEGANAVNIQLDMATYLSFKQFIADQKDALAKLGYNF